MARGGRLMRALLHPLRLRIIQLLSEQKLYPNQIAERLRRSRASVVYNLAILEEAGLIEGRYEEIGEGRFAKFYHVNRAALRKAVQELREALEALTKSLGECDGR